MFQNKVSNEKTLVVNPSGEECSDNFKGRQLSQKRLRSAVKEIEFGVQNFPASTKVQSLQRKTANPKCPRTWSSVLQVK